MDSDHVNESRLPQFTSGLRVRAAALNTCWPVECCFVDHLIDVASLTFVMSVASTTSSASHTRRKLEPYTDALTD